ncbi:enolase C-terminal domain-like protein [Sorangium sp. So ce1151]
MADPRPHAAVPIERVGVAAYTVPTDRPESDGTLEWRETTLVVAHASAGGERGLGYTYADAAAARVVADELAGVVRGRDAMGVRAARRAVGPDAALFVDANGAYSRKQALAFAERFAGEGVRRADAERFAV